MEYVSPASAPPRTLTLEEVNGGIRILFPVMPNWAYVLSITIQLCAAMLYALAGVVSGIATWHLFIELDR